MSTPDAQRPPFDAEDAVQANTYLASQRLNSFDPFASENASADLITTSLADARLMMEEAFATSRPDGQPFRVFPVLVESAPANAFAVKRGGLQVCGVNIGLAAAVYELALFVFSLSTLFRDIGDPAVETSPALPPNAVLSLWISDRIRAGERPGDKPVGVELAPRDGQRQTAALFLTILMLRFAWLHELFHCLNGHTGLRAEQGRTTALQELSQPPSRWLRSKPKPTRHPQRWKITAWNSMPTARHCGR